VLSASLAAVASEPKGTDTHTRIDLEPAEDEPAPSPISLGISYTFEGWANVDGGIDQGSRYLDNLDLTLEADLDHLVGWQGATFFAYGLYNNGSSISELVGDAQIVSNIETGIKAARLYELWISQEIGDNASLKLGLYDLNSEFDALEASSLFVGSAHGIGTDIAQTGEAGPSIFPFTSLAARLEVSPSKNLILRAAVLDGLPGDPDAPRRTAIKLRDEDGALLIAEVDATLGPARVLLGHWRYTGQFETWSGGEEDGNSGWYLRGESKVFSERNDPSQGLALFARFGVAAGKFNPFEAFVSGGVKYTGLISGRDNDQLGVAFATAFVSDELARTQVRSDHETAFEITYSAVVSDWLAIQPGLHFVINPSADPFIANATAAMVRTEISF
jgi:porin